jgi:hypothetical protein
MAWDTTTTPDSGLPRTVVADVSRQSDELVVSLQGDLDIAAVDRLVDVLAGAIVVDADELIIDLAEVRFIDAAAIGVLTRSRVLSPLESPDLTPRGPFAWVETCPGHLWTRRRRRRAVESSRADRFAACRRVPSSDGPDSVTPVSPRA